MTSGALTRSAALANGARMPSLGLGLFKMTDLEAETAVRDALEIGYRHFDTAKYYGNEAAVGRAIANSGIDRRDVFITTKLWNDDHGHDEAWRAFDRSLKELGMEHVDLYLVHWPKGERRGTWRAMEEILASGRARAIGVSNYTVRHLEEMDGYADVPPMVDQVESSPFLYQKELLDYCRPRGIIVEGHSPLARGSRLSDPRLAEVAKRSSATPAQTMLAWALAKGIVVIPKTTKRERMVENAGALDVRLSERDVEALDALDENLHMTWDPAGIP